MASTRPASPTSRAPRLPAPGPRIAAAMLAIAVLGFQASPALAAVTASERMFIIEAAQGGALEVSLGNLALERSTDKSVKALAQRLVKDHKTANDRLMAIARREGVSVPTGLPSAGRKIQQELMALEGPAFDRAYLRHMHMDHEQDIKAFEQQAKTVRNPQLKAFVAQTLPTLRTHEHLVMERMPGGGAGKPKMPSDMKHDRGVPREDQAPTRP